MVDLAEFTSQRGFVQPTFRQLTGAFFSGVNDTLQSVSHTTTEEGSSELPKHLANKTPLAINFCKIYQ